MSNNQCWGVPSSYQVAISVLPVLLGTLWKIDYSTPLSTFFSSNGVTPLLRYFVLLSIFAFSVFQGDRERRKSSRNVGPLDSALWLADLAACRQVGQLQRWIEWAEIAATLPPLTVP